MVPVQEGQVTRAGTCPSAAILRPARPAGPPYLLEERLCVWGGGLCGGGRAVVVSQGVLQLVFQGPPLSLLLLLLLLLGGLHLALRRLSFPWG